MINKNKKRFKYFRLGDLVIYAFFIIVFFSIITQINKFSSEAASSAEIYVDGELEYVYDLEERERKLFVPTNLGGVNVLFKDRKVRVTTSNSPLKLCVKQGWISEPGEVIIGIPDRLVIKVIGESNEDIDIILR